MLTLTKAYIIFFDGTQGTAVDYLDNEIDFHVSQVPPSVVPYLERNTEVIIEEDDDAGTILVTLGGSLDGSFAEREEEINEILLDEADADAFTLINLLDK